MGLDLLDRKFRIERAFHIDVSQDELVGLGRSYDIVIGDLYELILTKLHLCDVGRKNLRLNEFLWLEMQSALHRATGMPLEQIKLGLALETLFPRETRRARWQALREVCPYKIRGRGRDRALADLASTGRSMDLALIGRFRNVDGVRNVLETAERLRPA